MISLILPYYSRPEAADKALRLLADTYRGVDMEVVVVDDGSPVPFLAPAVDLNIKVLTLPKKPGPMCPATVWNAGVEAASGDIVVLSCVEVLHEKPVLEQMADEVSKRGSMGYVLAAAWCPEEAKWHCHSTVHVPDCPIGTGIAFCGAMHKTLFKLVGGFEPAYRDGAGYEDRDFIRKLLRAGARFVIRDDLVVTHPKSGATTDWPDGGFDRNAKLYEERWNDDKRKVTFCCVNSGNYCGRGAEYVNTLFDMVQRNLPSGMIFRFVCLTDDPEGLDKRIETLAMPPEVKGWYGKLYMFKRGLFADGERVVYLDLDTLIIGKLDDLVAYDGQFGTLEDFYYPERLGPAVISWQAGSYAASIWEEWVAEGMPKNRMGDLWWLNNLDQGRFAKRADRLQRLIPGMFASFKRDCAPYPPKGTKVVCFHGRPRPHEAAEREEWVAMGWKVGGSVRADLEVVGNTAYEETAKNIRAACALPINWLPIKAAHDGAVAVVGGGPSLAGKLDELRERQRAGAKVFATNGTHEYLLDHGITPDAHVIIDARAWNARFIKRPAVHYYLASQCHPDVFTRADGPTTLVHMNTHGILPLLPQNLQPINLISSGSTVGLAAIAIAYCLGYRKIFIYGMDSSFEEGHHAYPQPANDSDRVIEAVAGGRKFKAAPWMVAQVEHFQKLAAELAEADCEIHVRCGGLLGHATWLWTHQEVAA